MTNDLQKAITRLGWYYEQEKDNEYIHSPIAWALYHTWREFNVEKYERKKND